MRRLLLLCLVVVTASACANTDAERLDKVEVEGTTCIVARDNIGRAKFIDCDWGS